MNDGPTPITPDLIQDFNRRILKDLALDEPDVIPGEYRTRSVVVGPYLGAPAEDLEVLVSELCRWLEVNFSPPTTAMTFGLST
jgi:hypothetical protein